MKTEVVMHRDLFGTPVAQKSKSEYLSFTDLQKAGNRWRVANGLGLFNLSGWLRTESTKIFISEIEESFGVKAVIKQKEGATHTWVHPYLFIDAALAMSPKLKIEVYRWLHDYLLRYRNMSGDSYRLMTGALYEIEQNKRNFQQNIKTTAESIKKACKVSDWQEASERQLELRDSIHKSIAHAAKITKSNRAVSIGISIALEEHAIL